MLLNNKKQNIYFQQIAHTLLVTFLLLSATTCSATITFNQEFVDQFFLVPSSSGWESFNQVSNAYEPYTTQTICNSVSLLGGYQKLGAGSKLRKVFQNLPPHYELQIEFSMYFLDNVDVPQDNVYITLDNQNGGSFSLNDENKYRQLCGLQTKDRVWEYSHTIQHSNPSLTLIMYDQFGLTLNQQSWGIREFYLKITGICHDSCSSCSGPNNNQCLLCKNGTQPNNGVCPSINNGGGNNQGNNGGSNVNADWSACDTAISSNAQSFMYTKESSIEKNPVTYEQTVTISVKINFSNTNLSQECRQQMINKIYYQNSNQELQQFPAEVQSLDTSTYSLKLKFDLEDAKKYSRTYQDSNNQLTYSLYIIVINGNSKQMVRDHKFEFFIVLQGQKTFNYLVDVNTIDTESDCSDENNCIAIADVAIEGTICQNEDCTKAYSTNSKVTKPVGTNLITRLRFRDRSYNQALNLFQVLFRGDEKVFDLTNFSTVLFNDNKGTLIIQTQLFETSINAIFQYNLKIGDYRFLSTEMTQQNSQQKTINEQQSFQVKIKVIENSDNSQSNQATFGELNRYSILGAILLFMILF